jgi:mannose-6-phosphate isomerase-like protein (cupin superfamily)
MAVTTERYGVLSLDRLAPEGEHRARTRVHVRRELDIGAFGVNAYRAHEVGAEVVRDHSETEPVSGRHEELYLVVSGHATFTIEGEEVDAPAGSLVYVSDPESRRKAVAREVGTTVLAVGGRSGEPFVPAPWETVSDMWPLYEAGEYVAAIDVLDRGLERHPGGAILLYNLACMHSLEGRAETALGYLRRALEAHDGYRENAREDKDLDAIRGEPEFAEIVGSAGS